MLHIVTITIIIFIVGVLLCKIREQKFDNCKSKILKKMLEIISEQKLNEYLVNTVIAFLGVTAAIALTDFYTAREERIETIDYLQTVLFTELNTKEVFITQALIGINPSEYIQANIEVGGISEDEISLEIKPKYDVNKLFETLKIYPIVPVLSLNTLLTDSPYKHTISRYSYSALNDCKDSFNLQKIRVENAVSIEEMQRHLEHMADDFRRACEIVEIELEYQKGNIREEDVYNQIDILYDELRGNEDVMVIG